MRLNLVIAGVGGQGVVTLASVLVRAAVVEGYDARFLAQSGLSQIGAPVFAHVRVGSPAGPSPKVPRGEAHVAIGLERLEALRLAPYLRPGGTALLSDEAVRPYEARFTPGRYPGRDDVEQAFPGARIRWIPAWDIALRHGPPALVCAVMLGALAGVSSMVERDNLVRSLREAKPALADAEVEAFFDGFEAVTGRED